MEKEFLKARLETEQERCIEKLAELDPGAQEYSNCLYALQHLNDWLHCGLNGDEPAPTEPVPPPAVFPIETAEATETGPALKKEDVRAALADARMKGVDVSKLIAGMGASNLTGVDPADYPKLMDALAKELEGK